MRRWDKNCGQLLYCKGLLLNLILSCFPILQLAQTPVIDSLKGHIAQLPDDSNKVAALDALNRELIAINDYQQSLLVSHQLLDLAISMDDHKGISYGEAFIAYAHYFLGDYKQALKWIHKGRVSAKKWLNPIDVSTCYGNAGLVCQDMGQYDSALVYLLECLKIRQEIKDTVHWAYTHYDIAELFVELEDYEKAIEHHKKALELRELIPHLVDEYNVIEDSYCALAMVHHRDGNSEKAEALLKEALAINERKGDVKRKASTLCKLARIASDQGDFETSRSNLERSLELNRSINDLENVAENYIQLGLTYAELGHTIRSAECFHEAIAVAEHTNSRPRIVDAQMKLAQLYATSGNFEQAYNFLKQASMGKDSLLNDQKIKALKEAEVRYETARKEAQIQELNTQSELDHAEAARKAAEINQTRVMLVASVLGLIILIGLVLVARRSARIIQLRNVDLAKQKLEIEGKNEQILASLLEKESLLKEIHHRVKNNLQIISSLLNLQSSNMEDSAALEAIKEGQNRVKSIALIHQKLYQTEDLSKVDFQEYAEQLMSFLSDAFKRAGKEIETRIHSEAIQLDIDTAVPLGLIMNELVTNSYKYAFKDSMKGLIEISLINSNDRLQLTVSDTGPGLNPEQNIETASTLGLKLVRILARQMHGSVDYKYINGAVFNVKFVNSQARK